MAKTKEKPAPKKAEKKVETPKAVETKKTKKLVPTPITEAAIAAMVKTEVAVVPEPIIPTGIIPTGTFNERTLAGLTKKEIPGGRTIYVGEKDVKIEIIDGKLFNRGTLKTGWNVRISSGDKGILLNVDETKAMVKLNSSIEHSISIHSEVEIIDPEEKIVKAEKIKSETTSAVSTASTSVKPNSGRQQYSFNGQLYSKSFLAREIVAKYVLDNPSIDLKKLDKKFPVPFMGKYGLFKEVAEAKKISGNGLARYFFKPEQLIKVGNSNVAICNQITSEKINSIIEIAKTLGYADIAEL
jgi:hypothetical protein